MTVTEDVSHPEISLLKAELLNVAHMFVTPDVFQIPMSRWNDVVDSNIACILFNPDVSHFVMSALKLVLP